MDIGTFPLKRMEKFPFVGELKDIDVLENYKQPEKPSIGTFLKNPEKQNSLLSEISNSLKREVSECNGNIDKIVNTTDEPTLNISKLEVEVKTINILGEYSPNKNNITITYYIPDTHEFFQFTQIHERFHAAHHLWLDENKSIWDKFGQTDSLYLEFLAQLFTYKSIENNLPLANAFEKMNEEQPLEYRTWQAFKNWPEKDLLKLYWAIRIRLDSGRPLGLIDKAIKSICGSFAYEQLIEDTVRTLDSSVHSWNKLWLDYAVKISTKSTPIKEQLCKFRMPTGLRCYISVSAVNNSIKYSIRHKGEEIGRITVKDGVYLTTANSNIKMPWNGSQANLFRKYITKYKTKVRSKEHELEAEIIEQMELSDKSKFGGTFRDIQPVLLFKRLPFQMPVPISAHKGFPVNKKGNIDILARMGKGKGNKLTIIELKREGKRSSDKPIAQVLIYTVCIARLLRENPEWWKIFKYSRNLPNPLKLNAIAMLHINQKEMFISECRKLGIILTNGTCEISNKLIPNVKIILSGLFYYRENSILKIKTSKEVFGTNNP